jgi:hypothetical protein
LARVAAKKWQGASAGTRKHEGCQEPALWSGGKRCRAPASAEGAQRGAPAGASPKGRATECARPELSMRGACAAPRQGSSPEWVETPVLVMNNTSDRLSGSGRHTSLRLPAETPDVETVGKRVAELVNDIVVLNEKIGFSRPTGILATGGG